MRSTRTIASAAGVAVLSALLAGCGPLGPAKTALTTTAPVAATTTLAPTAPVKVTAASKVISAASAKVDASGSAKVDGTIVTKSLGATVTVPFAGKERWSPSEAASLVVSGVQVSGVSVGKVTVRVTGQAVYLELPSLASLLHKQWAKISLTGASSIGGADLGQFAGQAQQAAPGQYLRLLTQSVNVKALGTATIDGVLTRHYAGSVDLQKALAALPQVPEIWSKLATSEGIKAVHVNAWIDAGDRPRRITLALASSTVSLTVSLHLSSYGVKVTVIAPPAAETVDLTKGLLGAIS
ncbi:lipoprotein [Acidothermaceae bacterium B102]|nr:lipoprotein [Acidothermaceae bacterium B102]